MKTYTTEEIRNYITSQDSLGDVAYNLDRIDEILEKLEEKDVEEDDDSEIEDIPIDWYEVSI